jgi:hypothetical protein
MADIKTALKEALKEWDTDSTTKEEKQMDTKPDARSNMPQTFKITNNIARTTFNYVRDNPGLTAKQVGEHMRSLGLKPHSAVAMMSASVANGLMRRDENSKYYATADEYRPLKKLKLKDAPSVSIKKPKPLAPQQGIKALLAEPKQETPLRIVEPKLTNDYILSKLDVRQALSLYRELIDIFTGKHNERK